MILHFPSICSSHFPFCLSFCFSGAWGQVGWVCGQQACLWLDHGRGAWSHGDRGGDHGDRACGDHVVDAWSRFWRWILIKILYKNHSTLGAVVPLAMFYSCLLIQVALLAAATPLIAQHVGVWMVIAVRLVQVIIVLFLFFMSKRGRTFFVPLKKIT